jgi:hypothetical protein
MFRWHFVGTAADVTVEYANGVAAGLIVGSFLASITWRDVRQTACHRPRHRRAA